MKSEGLTAKQVQHMKPDAARRIEVPQGRQRGCIWSCIRPAEKAGRCAIADRAIRAI
jgi:hypothetical protein